MIYGIASDHAGFNLKEDLKKDFDFGDNKIIDYGPKEFDETDDYPTYAKKLCDNIDKLDFGILICGTGIGMSMFANKQKNVRAARCVIKDDAFATRQHNNANVLCLGSLCADYDIQQNIVSTFLDTEFSIDERHTRRLSQMEEPKKEIIIVAPHCDDEIIGCWEILQKEKPIIIYSGDTDNKRRTEALKLKEHTDIKAQLFQMTIPASFLNKNTTIYVTDPIYENHPLHRLCGSMGESFLRSGLDVIFYNTTMTAPYIHEVQEPDKKEELLNKVYPSQKDLWKYEKKYILFEGYNKWII